MTSQLLPRSLKVGKNKSKKWWDTLYQLGPKFGHYPEGGKSWLILKRNQEYAADIFRGTSIKITADGQRRLGAVIGSTEYKHINIQEKNQQSVD